MKIAMRAWWVVALGGWCCAGVHAQTGGYSFTVLESGIPDSTERCVAIGISGDGKVIAGTDTTAVGTIRGKPWVWKFMDGQWVRSQLPVPETGQGLPQDQGRATALSYSGDVIVGMVGNSGWNVIFNGLPAVWRNVLSDAPTLEVTSVEGVIRGTCAGVSSSGDRTLWWGQTAEENSSRQIWTWDADGTQTLRLPTVPTPLQEHFAGSLINGSVLSGNGQRFAVQIGEAGYLWEFGQANLIQNPWGQPCNFIAAISRDGRTLVGYSAGGNSLTDEIRPQAWNENGVGRRLRNTLPTRTPLFNARGAVLCVSGEGHVFGGTGSYFTNPYGAAANSDTFNRAMLWINDTPYRLDTYLESNGVAIDGVHLNTVTGVSDDGSTLVGYGSRMNIDTSWSMVSFVATIRPPGVCDDIDFNRDGERFDPVDIDAFLSVYSEGPCLPAGAQCRDIDFNNDGSLFDPEDINAFLRVFSEGPCVE